MLHRTMRNILCLLLIVLFAASVYGQESVRVLIDTELGEIEVEVDVAKAPGTAANFLRYADENFYDGGQFHRTVTMQNQPNNDVKIEVIQASVDEARKDDQFDPIPLERTTKTGLLHQDGAISMARDEPDSATASFFFCIGDQPELDFAGARNPDGQGFAAFGRITRGMDVVKKIQMSPREEQRLTPPVRIRSVRRVQ